MDQRKMGGLIRRLRKENGWTQRQLAEKMNISDKTVSKFVRGKFIRLRHPRKQLFVQVGGLADDEMRCPPSMAASF